MPGLSRSTTVLQYSTRHLNQTEPILIAINLDEILQISFKVFYKYFSNDDND